MSGFSFTVHTDHMPGGWHAAYMPVYERLFAPLRGCDRILEIGCDGSGFTLALASYFTEAEIITFDINQIPDAIAGNNQILHHQRDAYTMESVHLFSNERLDIAIDDGPHTIESQRFFVAHYPLVLRDGNSLAIVEDVQDINHFNELSACVPVGFFGFGIDLRMHDNRYDNLLFVIQRK